MANITYNSNTKYALTTYINTSLVCVNYKSSINSKFIDNIIFNLISQFNGLICSINDLYRETKYLRNI